MTSYIFTLLILLIGLIAIEVKKSYHALPIKELKYRATHGDELAASLYKAASYGSSLEAFLWFVIILCATGSLFLINSYAPFWLSFIAVALVLWVGFAWLPSTKSSKVANLIVKYSAPVIAWMMNYIHPAIHRFTRKASGVDHGHIYDQKDLINLINNVKNIPSSRINPEQLEIIKHCLDLPSKKTTDIAKAWSKVKTINEEETVGPVLLDELHKSEQQFIPVKDRNEPKSISGILDINKLSINATGRVSNYMDRTVYYLNEDDTLDMALHAFGQTNYPAFVIVDSKERLIGLLTFNDLIKQILSAPPGVSFSEYTDKMAVSEKYQAKEEEIQEVAEPL